MAFSLSSQSTHGLLTHLHLSCIVFLTFVGELNCPVSPVMLGNSPLCLDYLPSWWVKSSRTGTHLPQILAHSSCSVSTSSQALHNYLWAVLCLISRRRISYQPPMYLLLNACRSKGMGPFPWAILQGTLLTWLLYSQVLLTFNLLWSPRPGIQANIESILWASFLDQNLRKKTYLHNTKHVPFSYWFWNPIIKATEWGWYAGFQHFPAQAPGLCELPLSQGSPAQAPDLSAMTGWLPRWEPTEPILGGFQGWSSGCYPTDNRRSITACPSFLQGSFSDWAVGGEGGVRWRESARCWGNLGLPTPRNFSPKDRGEKENSFIID